MERRAGARAFLGELVSAASAFAPSSLSKKPLRSNTPGWTANGTNPYPTKAERAAKPFCESDDAFVQPDPIAAEAMLFFKGWLLLNMGVYARVSGDTAKWEREWTMSGIDDAQFPYTHSSAASHVATQWRNRMEFGGLH